MYYSAKNFSFNGFKYFIILLAIIHHGIDLSDELFFKFLLIFIVKKRSNALTFTTC